MRLLIADETLRLACEDPAHGIAVLGEAAFSSLSLVLDVLAPPTVNLASLMGLRSMSVQADIAHPERVVVTTNSVRVTFIPLIYTSAGELVMATNNARCAPDALQVLDVSVLPEVRDDQGSNRTKRRARP
jgi:hypothetical protein